MNDLPANFEKILSINTTTKQIIYFGHSQGGASILAGMSEKFEYFKEKLKVIVLLAPAARVDNINSNILHFISDIDLDERLKSRNILEILPYDPELCSLNIKIGRYYPLLSQALLEMTSDESSLVNCPERIRMYMAHYPSGSSLKSVTHFKQLIYAKEFQQFDYGKEINLNKYGSERPPIYDLSKIQNLPIILCGGLNDKLTHINDIRWLKAQLNSNTLFSYYEFQFMGHASFLINSDITWFNFVLRDIYKLLDQDTKVTSPTSEKLTNDTSLTINKISIECKKENKKNYENGSYEGKIQVKNRM